METVVETVGTRVTVGNEGDGGPHEGVHTTLGRVTRLGATRRREGVRGKPWFIVRPQSVRVLGNHPVSGKVR